MNSFFAYRLFKLLNIAIVITCLSSWNLFAADVLIIGDSMMKSVAREFKKECASKNLSAEAFTSIGSGLARMDLLNWHKKSKELVEENKPSLVLVMMGANDNQSMQGAGAEIPFGVSGWEIEYGRRCGKMMDILIEGGASRIVWFGLPCMREKKLDKDSRLISRIIKQQAAARKEVTYIPTYKMFSKKGKYSAYIIKKSGMPLNVRSDDGIHLNSNGAKYLVDNVSERILVK